ncbi:MAG: sigma-54-dependent transcriptional regulator [Limisphaerales bacterium]
MTLLPPLLVVDDEPNLLISLETSLSTEGYEVLTAPGAEAALRIVERRPLFMVITDARLGGRSGYDLLRDVKQRHPDLPVLLMTAYATPRQAVEAIQAGALDYLAKPFAPEELLHAVARCAERHRLVRENTSLRRSRDSFTVEQLIGDSQAMRDLRQLIQTVAPSGATVLILGESGTGKELIAGCLHSLSARRDAPYQRMNCAAIPEALLESELFGHEKGAFTGAVRLKPGRLEEADGGTVFLDEIGEMSRPLQAKLLRFLEDGTFMRVGGTEELRVDVRIVAATNRDIVAAIRAGEFREDLYHRLNVVQFRPPPLRERGEDIRLLAEHFLGQFHRVLNRPARCFSRTGLLKLLHHPWPGNVRELRNAIERAVILESGTEITAASLPDFAFEAQLGRAPAARSLEEALDALEREMIVAALERARYSLSRAADHLKLSRHALRYRMNRLGITEAGGDAAVNAPEQ